MITYSRPHIDDADVEAVASVLRTGMIANGPASRAFEAAFAEAVAARHAVALSSCTAALYMALQYHDIRAGDAVVVPTLTFAGTAQAALMHNADIVLADIDPTTLMMSADTLKAAVAQFKARAGRRVRAVILVHYAGQIGDVAAISAYCRMMGIHLVHDCAHCLESDYRDAADADWKRVGTLEDICCFSFYPTKCITTGMGGMLTSNDPAVADWCRRFANHGITKPEERMHWDYDVAGEGFKLCMPDLLAALGLSQLKKAPGLHARRLALAARYTDALQDTSALCLPSCPENRLSSMHMYVVRLTDMRISRDALLQDLKEQGIVLSVHWRPLHLHQAFRDLETDGRCFISAMTTSDALWPGLFSLPCYPAMTDEEQDMVISALQDTLARHAASA